ncbi:MAG: hypothetical protein KF732_04355 [Flavobacteriales bacterium]|nr:hypothetical protein [Flavobacteriales bacterium]
MLTPRHLSAAELLSLLLLEYEQYCLYKELENKKWHFSGERLKIFDVVLDMIGFPEKGDEDFYNRQPLYNSFNKVCSSLQNKQGIVVTDEGLELKDKATQCEAAGVFIDFAESLINEFEIEWKLNNSINDTPIKKIGNWLITEKGIKWEGRGNIFIEKGRLLDLGSEDRRFMYDWLLHLAEKNILKEEDIYSLNTAFMYATDYFHFSVSPFCFSRAITEQQKIISKKKII